jgi:Flp pilus assembly protein TadD
LAEGLRLAAQGNLPQALEALRQAIEKDPKDYEDYNCLGTVQYGAKLYEQAGLSFQQALAINPACPEALSNLGVLFIERQLLNEAKTCFLQAIQARPNYSSAYNNLGLLQVREQLLNEAEISFRRAINLKTDFAEAFNNLGLLLKDTKRCEEAVKSLFHAIKLKPDFAEAHNNLGTVLTDLNRFDVAETCFCRAAQLKPAYPDPYHNLGIVFINTNRLDKAEACFSRALQIKPDYSEAEFALATLYLLQGRFEKGWEKFDKWRIKTYGEKQPDVPRWQGEDIAGSSILLYYEQGFGDTLHFVRYATMVASLAQKVTLWVQNPLCRLIASSFPGIEIHCSTDMPAGPFAFACPLPSLPRILNTSLESIPRNNPYMKPDTEVAKKWGKVLAQTGGGNSYRIGVVWAGNPNHHNDRNRSIPMEEFKTLFTAKAKVSWISLQVGERASDVTEVSCAVFSWPDELVDFAETAGLIENLDLVITVDSAVAHLAGAMGKMTWLLLPFAPDWRWQLKREDSPWYPTMRLFRQRETGAWPEVVQRVKEALTEYLPVARRRL